MKITIPLFLICLSLSATAQDGRMGSYMPMMSRSIGASFQKFEGLNSRVANLPQFEQLKDYVGTIGFGWLKEKKRLVSNGGITAGSSLSGHRDKKSSALRMLAANADIGYDVLKSEKLMLFPLAGLGVQGYQAIFYKDNSAVNFNDVLQSSTIQNNISSVKFTNSFFVYRLGLGFAVKSTKYPGHSIGIQAGYTGSFKKSDWKSKESQTLANAPTDKISQVYVSLVLSSKSMFMH